LFSQLLFPVPAPYPPPWSPIPFRSLTLSQPGLSPSVPCLDIRTPEQTQQKALEESWGACTAGTKCTVHTAAGLRNSVHSITWIARSRRNDKENKTCLVEFRILSRLPPEAPFNCLDSSSDIIQNKFWAWSRQKLRTHHIPCQCLHEKSHIVLSAHI